MVPPGSMVIIRSNRRGLCVRLIKIFPYVVFDGYIAKMVANVKNDFFQGERKDIFMAQTNNNIDWQQARDQILIDPNTINLNTGSFGLVPKSVFRHVTQLRQRLAEEPMDFFLRQGGPWLWESRECLAEYIGTQPERVVFTVNVSAAINLIANSLRLATPGEILLTDHEYGAMHWCWDRAAQRQGLKLRTFELPVIADDPQTIVEAFVQAFRPETRLLFFSHVLSPTGLILPAKEICAEARKRGILTVVDGAHTPGMVPLNVTEIAADFYCANLHKWLLAPTGSAFLHIGMGNKNRLTPMHVSWGYYYDSRNADEKNEFGVTNRIYRLEFEGTRDPCAWIAVKEAIAFQRSLGFDNICARNEELWQHSVMRFHEEMGLPLWISRNRELHAFLSTFRLPAGVDVKALQKLLWERHKIEIPAVERPYGNLLRVSTHFYNTKEEIDRLAEVLPPLLHETKK